jgi:two-component system sensor histidine kinase KdpD
MAEQARRSPDALLARLKDEDRARLRIYIGAAPGVGKTYEMLAEAHALRARGLDVVVGYVETYGRADTEAQLKGLEVIPRRTIDYRGVTMEDLDVDSIIERMPQVCVVDELAHTNVPGNRRVKRYEDVLDILAAGIHVMTAVNIQHLETLNDAVARATGVRVRETVPDTFLDRADEVINVDVTVEELRNRLREGKIYRPEKVEQALSNFFRKGNLSTLRELALRAVADEVSEKAASYRAREGLEPALIPERVMVCMSSNTLAPRVIRAGARIAGRLGSKWYAVYVETPDERPGRIASRNAEALQQNIKLAESLGATVVRVKAARPSDGLVAFAPAGRRDPRDLRPDVAIPVGTAVARLDARQVSRGGTRRGGAGRAVHRTLECVAKLTGQRVLSPRSPTGCSPNSTCDGRGLRARRAAPLGATRRRLILRRAFSASAVSHSL